MDGVNSCEALKAKFPCPICRADSRADSPAFVELSNMCLINEKANFDCNGRHPSAKRLCLCLNIDALRR